MSRKIEGGAVCAVRYVYPNTGRVVFRGLLSIDGKNMNVCSRDTREEAQALAIAFRAMSEHERAAFKAAERANLAGRQSRSATAPEFAVNIIARTTKTEATVWDMKWRRGRGKDVQRGGCTYADKGELERAKAMFLADGKLLEPTIRVERFVRVSGPYKVKPERPAAYGRRTCTPEQKAEIERLNRKRANIRRSWIRVWIARKDGIDPGEFEDMAFNRLRERGLTDEQEGAAMECLAMMETEAAPVFVRKTESLESLATVEDEE